MISCYFSFIFSLLYSRYMSCRKNSLRHNYSAQLRPATKITLMWKVLGINEFSQIERPCLKIFPFFDYEAHSSSQGSTSESCLLLGTRCTCLSNNCVSVLVPIKGCLFICFVSNSVLPWDSCSSLCLVIIVVLKSVRVLFIFQETLYYVLYTVYFSSVIIPVTIKMIMK